MWTGISKKYRNQILKEQSGEYRNRQVDGFIPSANAKVSTLWLLLPAAAEGLINLYQCEEFVEPGLREAQFC